MDIVYAELVFDEGSKNSCHTAFCVFEDPSDEGKRQSTSSIGSGVSEDRTTHRFSSISSTSELSIQSFVEQMEDDLDMEESIKFLNEKWKEDEQETPAISYICSGVTVIGDGKIVVSTKSGEIALYGATGKFLSMKKFSESFQGLTNTAIYEIAISCGNCICFYRVEKNKVQRNNEKCIEFRYADVSDIHYVDKGFIISCRIQSQVLIMKIDMEGNILKTLEHVVTSVDHFCCCSSGETIFLIERDHRRITAIKQDGSVIWELTIDYVPTYVTLAGKDRIAVSLMGRPDVKCMTLTGNILGHIDTGLDPACTPLMLAYSAQLDSLVFCPEEIKRPKSLKKNPFSKVISFAKLD